MGGRDGRLRVEQRLEGRGEGEERWWVREMRSGLRFRLLAVDCKAEETTRWTLAMVDSAGSRGQDSCSALCWSVCER